MQPITTLTDRGAVAAISRFSGRHPSLLDAGCVVFVVVAILAIACLHYAGQTLARGPDQADILLAFFHEASHSVQEEGFWAAMYTPGARAGVSNWSNPNFNPLYPLYLNWVGADVTVYATLDRLNAIIYLHLAILGAGGFLLARALGVRLLPAICVGLVLPWFPAVRSAAAWPHIIAGMAWLPWIFAFQVRTHTAADARAALCAVIGLALAATLLIYAQPAQNLVFAVFGSVLVWTLVAMQQLFARDHAGLRNLMRTAVWLTLAAALVAAATGSYLLEVLRFHEQSIRWLGAYGGYVIGEQPVPVGALRFHALDAVDAGLIAAFEYRRGIGNAYLGLAIVVAGFTVFAPGTATERVRMARAMLACTLVSALFCFAFMAPLIHLLPLVNKVRELTWWSCLAVVLLLPVAALGMQMLTVRRSTFGDWRKDPWFWLLLAALLLAVAATSLAATTYRVGAMTTLLLGFTALGWLRLTRTPTGLARDLVCIMVLACAVWIPFHHNIEFARTDATLFEPDRVQARADAGKLRALLLDEDEYRIVLDNALPNAHLLTHAYTSLGFRALRGGIGPTIHAKEILLGSGNETVSALYGVKYRLLPESVARTGDELLRPGLALRTDPSALPRLFFVAGGVGIVDDPVATLVASAGTAAVQVLIARGDLPPGLDVDVFAAGTAEPTFPHLSENRRTRIHATLNAPGRGLLVLNEDPDGRWRGWINGQSTPAFRVNGFQTAFVIAAAGRHEIVIERPGRLFGGGP